MTGTQMSDTQEQYIVLRIAKSDASGWREAFGPYTLRAAQQAREDFVASEPLNTPWRYEVLPLQAGPMGTSIPNDTK